MGGGRVGRPAWSGMNSVFKPGGWSNPFFGPAAVEAVNSVKVEPVVNSGEGGKAQLHDFRHEFSAPVTGSHSAPEWDG